MSCGVTTGSVVVCQSSSGAQTDRRWLGPLTEMSVGASSLCGIRPDGSILCWGGNTIEYTPPGGVFKTVSTGRDRACALRTDGTAVCWGLTVEEHIGLTTPPSDHPPYFAKLAEWSEPGSVPIPPGAPDPSFLPFIAIAEQAERKSCGRLCSKAFWREHVTMEAVQAELASGADLSLTGDDGASALHWAVNKNAGREIIELLLEAGANPNLGNADGDTALHRAVEELAVQEIIDLLIGHGADVQAKNYTDITVLALAVGTGNDHEVIETLLARGADPNTAKTTYGDTALSAAVIRAAFDGDSEIVRILLESGADATEMYYDDGLTLLEIYYSYLFDRRSSDRDVAPNVEVIELLLDHGVDVHATAAADLLGFPLLFFAVILGASEPESVRLLLEHGASATTTASWGITALHYALQFGSADVVKHLLDYGADVSARTDHGNTPLHAAVRTDAVDIVRLLLENHADPSAQNDDGDTPLHLIVRSYDFEPSARSGIIGLLVEHGADTQVVNSNRRSVCDLIKSLSDEPDWGAAIRQQC